MNQLNTDTKTILLLAGSAVVGFLPAIVAVLFEQNPLLSNLSTSTFNLFAYMCIAMGAILFGLFMSSLLQKNKVSLIVAVLAGGVFAVLAYFTNLWSTFLY